MESESLDIDQGDFSPEPATEPRATGTQAIERALAALDCFISAEPELGVTEVAQALALSPSTVHRILRALVGAGYLDQNRRTNRYYLGRRSLLLGQVAHHNFAFDLTLPVLESLAEQTGESVNLGVRDRHGGIVAVRVESRHALRFDQPPGTRVALHASAMGKALLAWSPDRAREVAELGPLIRLTEHTHVRSSELLADLAETHERGYSMDDEESIPGVRCLGAPVLDRLGWARAALALQAPLVRMPDDRIDELVQPLREAARRTAELIPPDRRM